MCCQPGLSTVSGWFQRKWDIYLESLCHSSGTEAFGKLSKKYIFERQWSFILTMSPIQHSYILSNIVLLLSILAVSVTSMFVMKSLINLENGVEIALMESFKEMNVVVIGHHPIQKSRKDYYIIDFPFCVLPDVIAFWDALVKFARFTLASQLSVSVSHNLGRWNFKLFFTPGWIVALSTKLRICWLYLLPNR